MKPAVSVIIPSYNHERYIRAAVESVLEQTFADLELIVIDDGSKDRSKHYLRRLRDRRLRYFEQENAGAHAAINRGLALARGDYLTVLNSDDRYERARVERLIDFLTSENADLVGSHINIVNESDVRHGVKRGWENALPGWTELPAGFASNDPIENLLISNYLSTTSNFFFKRAVYDTVGGMRDLRYVHDWDFALRVAAQFRIGILPDPLLNYRVHSQNTIKESDDAVRAEILQVYVSNLPGLAGVASRLGLDVRGDDPGAWDVKALPFLGRFEQSLKHSSRLAPWMDGEGST